ncbi:glycoside hydrolase family 5 protein [Xanthomonas graminis]|uniref:glycoside hydrolase family 5 protein n=1 Tax=Xanthomonas graminis TaxID=3390026 RepID=UPI00092DFDEB|nr:glycoside hydrolase family 5 protein [Xanthomonas translucens pv. graminis]SBV45031.1 cellulase [Xanthomonas translucens pv. graminis]SBV56504.1 cellulase [Xanthomonas translucens pv. graminis]
MRRISSSIAPPRRLLREALCMALAACASTAIVQDPVRYAGVNLAGAEFNSARKPGVVFKDYLYPSDSDYAYVAAQGMNIVRLPFLWERLQPTANGALDAAQLGYLRTAVSRAKSHNLRVILDLHNYAKYNGVRIGSDGTPASVLADLWRRLAIAFGNDDTVIFGLMNEPNGISSGDWAATAQLAIDAIRSAGAYNLIMVPGTAFSGAHSWNSTWYGVPNAQSMVSIEDPVENLVFEVHQYLDQDYSGTSADCISASIGSEKLRGFTKWLRDNGHQGFLGEFGASNNATCMAALDDMLGYVHDNDDVWMGWTAWAAGAWWKIDYAFSLRRNPDGTDKPQMGVLSARAKQLLD